MSSNNKFDGIPDRWDMVSSPKNQFKRAVRFYYHGAGKQKDPTCIIALFPPDDTEGVDGAWEVEVQDRNGEKGMQSTLLPVDLRETFPEYKPAVNRVSELLKKYPLEETRTGAINEQEENEIWLDSHEFEELLEQGEIRTDGVVIKLTDYVNSRIDAEDFNR